MDSEFRIRDSGREVLLKNRHSVAKSVTRLLRRKKAGADILFVTAVWIPHKFSFALARKKILRNDNLFLKFPKTFFFRVSFIFSLNPKSRILNPA